MSQRSTVTPLVRTLLRAAALAVCLAPLQAQDSAAKVLEEAGRVSLMKDGYLVPLNTGDPVRQKQMIVTGPDGYARFEVLSDHSTFEVFPNSRVIFRPTLGSWTHLIDMVLGRIKVYIQHEPGKPNPNEVSSPTAVISVRGTVFDVTVQDDDTTIVSVDEGVVLVRNQTAPGASVPVGAGQSLTVIRNQPIAKVKVDPSGAIQKGLRAAQDAAIQVLLGRRGAVPGIAGTGSGTGISGDRGKPTGSGPGSTPGASGPGAAPGSGGGGN